MSQSKDKYFELLVREETMKKYVVRANDQQQAERIFEDFQPYYDRDNKVEVCSQDRHIIDISSIDGKPF